jgi:hypothetical protein
MRDIRTQAEIGASLEDRRVWVIVGALTVAGFLLRLACARGDLWLDEIWSVNHIRGLANAGDILWRLPSTNNHLLNSLWLWIVGPSAPVVLIRLESIIVGTLTVPVAAQLCGRSGPAAAITGAALAAGATIFVQYGSEARGYAGLLLMIFVAAEALERFLENPSTIARFGFAGAVALGALFHLTMLQAAATLIAATLLRLKFRGRSLFQILVTGLDLGLMGILGAVPALALLAASILNTHRIEIGALTPFSAMALGQSLTALYAATLGLPFDLPLPFALLLCFGLTGLVALLLAPERLVLPLTTLLLPAAMAALTRTPNVQYPRFDLVAVLGLVLLASDVAQKFWRERRWAALFGLGGFLLIGNAVHLEKLFVFGRGNIRPLVARMARDGAATFGTNLPPETWASLHFYDPRGALALVQSQDWCARPPNWYVLTDRPGEELPKSFGPDGCAGLYRLVMVVERAPLSGLGYALYQGPHHSQ